MIKKLLLSYSILFLISSHVSAQVPIGGKSVYIKQSNLIWTFSFAKLTTEGNTLYTIDLNKSFNTLNPPMYVQLHSKFTRSDINNYLY